MWSELGTRGRLDRKLVSDDAGLWGADPTAQPPALGVSSGERQQLLQYMQRFGLCIPLPIEADKVIVPTMLTATSTPETEWAPSAACDRRLHICPTFGKRDCKYLPAALFHRVMARLVSHFDHPGVHMLRTRILVELPQRFMLEHIRTKKRNCLRLTVYDEGDGDSVATVARLLRGIMEEVVPPFGIDLRMDALCIVQGVEKYVPLETLADILQDSRSGGASHEANSVWATVCFGEPPVEKKTHLVPVTKSRKTIVLSCPEVPRCPTSADAAPGHSWRPRPVSQNVLVRSPACRSTARSTTTAAGRTTSP